MSVSSQEEALLAQFFEGNRAAFKAIFTAHYPKVCAVTYRYLGDQGLAEDLAQEVFIRLWQKREQLQITSNLAAYLRRMAVNEALAHLRKKTRFLADELPIHLPNLVATAADESLDSQELQQRIQRVVASLPDRCRLIFELSRYEELSNREIAEQLDISIKTVENQMTKALRTLREALSDYLVLGPLVIFPSFLFLFQVLQLHAKAVFFL